MSPQEQPTGALAQPAAGAVGEGTPAAAVGTPFAARETSATWEWLPLDGSGANHFWAWFRPPAVPDGIAIQIPDVTRNNCRGTGQLTIRSLMQATGVDPLCVPLWFQYGVAFQGQGSHNPTLDLAVPDPVPGADTSIVFQVAVVAAAVAPASVSAETVPPADEQIYEVIAAHWNAAKGTEMKLINIRKKMVAMQERLKGLNRDLTFEENNAADRSERDEWEDARRWIRNVLLQLSRYVKSYDIGDTSASGKKEWFEQIYEEYIQPQRPIDDIRAVYKEFEVHRKTLLTLESQMSSALSTAGADGAQRAQGILSRLAAKVQMGRSGDRKKR